MKFEVKLSYILSEKTRLDSVDPITTFEMEGDLNSIKTYVKLANSENFNWGAIQRLDGLEPGDVERWLIRRNRTTGELYLAVFSFFEVDPEININTLRQATDPETEYRLFDEALGGGYF